jgi:hypothetical protein
MSSVRQIMANRRNALLSTGPVTEEGKKRSRRNAIRHGLTAETVIDALEDAEDYAAFQMAVTADYDAQSTVERELVLRLASLLWRLRRATAIETGLFKVQARYLLRHRKKPETLRAMAQAGRRACGDVVRLEERGVQQYGCQPTSAPNARSPSAAASSNPSDDLTRSFVRLNNLGTCPLDRLSRYEAMLWRQACQLLFTLQFMNRRKPWDRLKLRP